MKYCVKCGKELFDEAVICPGCGCPTETAKTNESKKLEKVLRKLSDRIKINGAIWLTIGILQIIIGVQGFWWVMVVGILNVISAVNDFKYCQNAFFKYGIGVFDRYQPIVKPIIVMMYNLLIGGVIGVIGSVYYLAFIRAYVMENEDVFPKKNEGI